MDVMYTCELDRRQRSHYCPPVSLHCAWSCRNLIAFTSENANGEHDASFPIHIMDPEHPWDACTVALGHQDPITCLQWDHAGSRLLSGDGGGHVRCWGMTEGLVGGWECQAEAALPGEPLVTLAWLHNGVKLNLHPDKAAASNFCEKFSRVKFAPSLMAFGGRATDGWIGITGGGLVSVWLPQGSGSRLLTTTEPLCHGRTRVALADVTFTSGGQVVVGVSSGSAHAPIHFYRVWVSVVREKARLNVELMAGIFLRSATDPTRRDRFPAVGHLRFLSRESPDQVLICVLGSTGSMVESWTLRKEFLAPSKLFPGVGDKSPPLLRWNLLAISAEMDRVTALAPPGIPLSVTGSDLKAATDSRFFPGLGIAVALADGSVQILHRFSLQRLATLSLSLSLTAPSSTSMATPIDLQVTKSLTTSLEQVIMVRVPPSLGLADGPPTLRHLLLLLEFCLVTGHDPWDIIIHAGLGSTSGPGAAAALADRLAEEYSRQVPPLQQALHSRVLSLRAWLYRICPGTAHRSADLMARLLLQAVSAALKGLLRPAAGPSGTQHGSQHAPERSPGERLAETCAKNGDCDIDKVMLNLRTEEFVLDTPLLQALQQLIQWVADFSLHLLAGLPHQASSVRGTTGLARDPVALGWLRELLVVIRIWGLIKSACLPVLHATSDSQDSLSLAFRLLTRLWLCCNLISRSPCPKGTKCKGINPQGSLRLLAGHAD
uniref:Mediator of RNA polymerase II transcription subunit 16 n=1 Tax=Eptatretus burgeri TaxID=7764 RepID=A0A8C4NCY0_EPTBU